MDEQEKNFEGENVIEFLRNQGTATVTFCQGRYITRIRSLMEEYPDDVKIMAENKDGSIVAHIPVKWVKIGPPRHVSDEQREIAAERLREMRETGKI